MARKKQKTYSEMVQAMSKARDEIMSTETDKMVGRLRDGMSVEIFDHGKWIPGKVHLGIMASWFIYADKDGPVTREDCRGLYSGLKVRLH